MLFQYSAACAAAKGSMPQRLVKHADMRGQPMKAHPIHSYPFLKEHAGPQGMYIEISCSKCNHKESRRHKHKDMSIDNVHLPYWRHHGWEFRKEEAICKTCRQKERAERKAQPLKVSIAEIVSIVPDLPKEQPKEVKKEAPKKIAPTMLTIGEVLQLTNVSRDSIYRAAQSGKISGAVKTDTGWKFEKEGLNRWLEAQESPPKERSLQELKKIVEDLHDLPTLERGAYLKKTGIPMGSITQYRRDYIEGKLGVLDRVVHIRALQNPLHPITGRKFTMNYRQTVLAEIEKVKVEDLNLYLQQRGLTKKLLDRWKPAQEPMSHLEPVTIDAKTQFALFSLLNEHCPKGRYEEGWSDDRCAKELVILSSSYVAKVRQEIFPTNLELVQVRNDLEALKKKFDADMNELRDLEKTIRDDFQRQYDGLSDRLAAIEAR